eukprot:3287976-Pleurochrysis_carterae.AAC.2
MPFHLEEKKVSLSFGREEGVFSANKAGNSQHGETDGNNGEKDGGKQSTRVANRCAAACKHSCMGTLTVHSSQCTAAFSQHGGC